MEQQPSPVLTLQLSVEQVNAVLNALGKLPSETGVYPLMININDQASQQLAALQAEQPTEDKPTE